MCSIKGESLSMSTGANETLNMVADIGGTHCRFAACDLAGRLSHLSVLKTKQYPSLEAAMEHYFQEYPELRPRAAAIAIANPVTGDEVRMTNTPWTFSTRAVRARFGLDALHIINDFQALAMAVPLLSAADVSSMSDAQPA